MSKDEQIQFQALSKVAVELVKAGKTEKEDLQKVVSITKYLMAALPKNDGSRAPSKRIDLSSSNANDFVLTVGKHSGKKLSEVDEGYLRFLADKSKNADLRRMAGEVLSGRNPDLESAKVEF